MGAGWAKSAAAIWSAMSVGVHAIRIGEDDDADMLLWIAIPVLVKVIDLRMSCVFSQAPREKDGLRPATNGILLHLPYQSISN
jgi:hypothetical protein